MRWVWLGAAQQLIWAVALPLWAGAQASGPPMQPVIHHLSHDAPGAEAVQKLPKAAAVVFLKSAAGDNLAKVTLPELIAAFASAATSPKHEVPAKAHLALLATGPLLDSPDQVVAQPLRRAGNRFTLALFYTSARATGRNLERNLRWLPMAQAALPDDLAPGEYSVAVTWQAVDSLSSRAALPVPALHEGATFLVRP